jgi:hypothetical protein
MKAQSQEKSQIKLKRVIKRGDEFLCGICHRRYEHQTQALSCLKSCSASFLNDDSVGEKEGKGRFQCRYCRRLYSERGAALDCARLCRSKAKSRLETAQKGAQPQSLAEKRRILEQLGGNEAVAASHNTKKSPVTGSPATHSPARTHGDAKRSNRPTTSASAAAAENRASAAKQRPAQPRQRPAAVRKPSASSQSSGPSSAAAQASVQAPVSPPAAEAAPADQGGLTPRQLEYMEKAKRLNVKRDKDKFVRSGAQYVCRVCNEKYYTKVEVLDCFDAHLQPRPAADDNAAMPPVASGTAPAGSGGPGHGAPTSSATAPADSGVKLSRDGKGYICQHCEHKYATQEEAGECFKKDKAQDSAAKMERDAEIDEKAAKGGLFRLDQSQDDKSKFRRDGARYVCRACRKRYFSRSEVIECFDSHQ